MASSQALCQETTCPICLDYYKDPVATDCGHNFCRLCVLQLWGGRQPGGAVVPSSSSSSCPQCRASISQERLRPNRPLANIVEIAKRLQEEEGGQNGGGGTKRKGQRLCEEHQEPLKLFCKDEGVPICVVCDRATRHRGHLVLPIEEVAPEDKVTMMSPKTKRKIDAECRVFNPQWTHDYFFIQHKEKAVCLICQDTVSVFREYNLHQHYQTQHKGTYDGLVGQVRKNKISQLKTSLASQQNIFVKQKQQTISSMRASYEVAQAIASTGRPFTEGEFVKDCLLRVVKVMCPEKADLFSTLSLSARTVTQRIEEMGGNLQEHLQNSAKNFSYFSLALDESNDVRDSAQLLIFIRGINDNFEVTEELAALQSIKGTTTGEDIYEMVCQTVNGLELDWAKLVSVTTDGAPSMLESKRGVIARINQEMDKHNHSHPIAIHCLIHQQVLCSKSLKWDSVMKTVVSCVNFLRANALNHRQFQEFLSEANEDVLYHTEVRWLSRGGVLRCFYDLLPEITAFLVSRNKEVPELSDGEWKWHLAFLTDVTEFLNNFSVQLQGKGKLISDMQSHVKEFEAKLGLLIKQVKEENFCQLPTTQKLLEEKPSVAFPTKTCVNSLEKLQSEFQVRFKELHLHEQDIQLFSNPFSADIEKADIIYQIELCDLHSCDSLKEAFQSSSLLSFYASLPSEKYPNLRNHALKIATIFGSTYICEQTFSRMKHLKSPTRSRLSDAHLHHLLRLAVTNTEPDIDHIISQKQAQSSH